MIIFGLFDALRAVKKNLINAWKEERLAILIDLILVGLSASVLFTMI